MWIRIDDQLRHHEKWQGRTRPARCALFELWGHAGEFLTDGFVPEREALRAAFEDPADDPETILAELERARLIHRVRGGRVVGCQRCQGRLPAGSQEGVQIHDWVDWNPSREQVLEERATLRAQRSAAGKARALKASRVGGRFVARGATIGSTSGPLVDSTSGTSDTTSGPLVNSTSEHQRESRAPSPPVATTSNDSNAGNEFHQRLAGENHQRPPADEPAPSPVPRSRSKTAAPGLGDFTSCPEDVSDASGRTPDYLTRLQARAAAARAAGPDLEVEALIDAQLPKPQPKPERGVTHRQPRLPSPTELTDEQVERLDHLCQALGRKSKSRGRDLSELRTLVVGYVGRGGDYTLLEGAMTQALERADRNPVEYLRVTLGKREPLHNAAKAEAEGQAWKRVDAGALLAGLVQAATEAAGNREGKPPTAGSRRSHRENGR